MEPQFHYLAVIDQSILRKILLPPFYVKYINEKTPLVGNFLNNSIVIKEMSNIYGYIVCDLETNYALFLVKRFIK